MRCKIMLSRNNPLILCSLLPLLLDYARQQIGSSAPAPLLHLHRISLRLRMQRGRHPLGRGQLRARQPRPHQRVRPPHDTLPLLLSAAHFPAAAARRVPRARPAPLQRVPGEAGDSRLPAPSALHQHSGCHARRLSRAGAAQCQPQHEDVLGSW